MNQYTSLSDEKLAQLAISFLSSNLAVPAELVEVCQTREGLKDIFIDTGDCANDLETD